jgi:hypothetical protein
MNDCGYFLFAALQNLYFNDFGAIYSHTILS